MTAVATLIGDVVGSRSVADRRALHARLEEVLADVNARTEPLQPLRLTVGDEFQGAWRRRGEVTALSDDGNIQDGPGWWQAREAISLAKADEERARGDARVVRTRWVEDSPTGLALDAALRHRDLLLADLDERSRRLLRGLLAGSTQRALAEAEGISPTAVSRRVRRDGLDQVVTLDAELAALA